jgi:hypothetical protein
MKIYRDIDEDGNDAQQWHELHDCTCPVCLGPAEHRIVTNGYEDIECMEGCGLVWLRGVPGDPEYFIDKRPDKRKPSCDHCDGLTVH